MKKYMLVLLMFSSSLFAQTCESIIEFELLNYGGGVFANQKVTLTDKADGKVYSQNSDEAGKVSFTVPCDDVYAINITNFSRKDDIKAPHDATIMKTLKYKANMAQIDKALEMSAAEMENVEKVAKDQPDSIVMKNSHMNPPRNPECFFLANILVKDIKGFGLGGESVVLTGTRRGKSVSGYTDNSGRISAYLPKGDTYTVNFKYNKNFSTIEYGFHNSSAEVDLILFYLGTKEMEKRTEEERQRIKAEERRLRAEKEFVEAECKRLGISITEYFFRGMRESVKDFKDTVVGKVLNRNKWKNKLIICDLTCSMHPYAAQLSVWYQLNLKKDTNLQFIFFNEGDDPSNKKRPGNAGGVFYTPGNTLDSLKAIMVRVLAVGCSGDCAENDMEALIKGVKMAKPYKELVAIVDNNAPVRDIELLKQFNKPVHLVLCGVYDDLVLLDYLLIAWKTKGSIHTMEQDITRIANMSEGEEIKIGKVVYRIMGGEFVRITDI